MKKEINTLFALIRCAVLKEKMSDESKEDAAHKAELLYNMARHHDMAHLLDYAYKMSKVSVPDEQVAFKFIKQNALSVMRYENLNLALVNISGLLEEEQIQFIALKGAVIRNFYPEPWMRTSCDIDILVHEEDLERAERAIVEKLGFTSNGKRGYHDISLYSDTDVHLELHFNIKENVKNIDGLLEKVWEYSMPKAEGSYECVLTNEFLMFQHIAHMSYHVLNGGCSLRYFLDLFLLENRLGVDRNVFVKMLEECKLLQFYEASLKLSRVWFSDEKHDETTLLFQKYLLGAGVYGIKKNQIAFKRRQKGSVSYLAERIFMPYEQLIIKYPELNGKRYLTPFYQLRRWTGFVLGRKYANSGRELLTNREISDKKAEEVYNLFKKIGLDK